MPLRRARHATCLALLAACTPAADAPPADAAAAVTPPHQVALAVGTGGFEAPDTIAAGWTTFVFANTGHDIHYAHIVRLDSARTVEDLAVAYAEAIRTSGPRPAWVRRFGGPGGAAPGDTMRVTQHLDAGEYVWICPVEDDAGRPHFSNGEVKAFVVRADSASAPPGAAPLAPTATIHLSDYAFTPEAPLTPGQHRIRVVNDGAEPHDLSLLKLAEGKTVDDVRAWLDPERARREVPAKPLEVPLDNLDGVGGGVAAMAPGMEAYVEATLTPGEYVLACMVTAPDGRSHIEHGMIRQISVR